MAHVLVHGGGFGGLAAAARLTRLGHEVVVAEPGGALGRPLAAHEHDGATVDVGAPFTTLPAALRDLFHKSGGPPDPALELVPVDPTVRLDVAGAPPVALPATSRAGTIRALTEAYDERTAQQWTALIARAQRMWEVAHDRLYEPEHPLPWYARRRRALAPATPLHRFAARGLDGPGGAALRAYLLHLAAEAGFRESDAPASAAALAYVEETFGVWQIPGGLHLLVPALVERVTARGRGTVRTDVAPADRAHLAARADVVVHDRSPQAPGERSLTAGGPTRGAPGRTVSATDAWSWTPPDGSGRPPTQLVVRLTGSAAATQQSAVPDHATVLVAEGSPHLGAGLPFLAMSAARAATRIGRA